ncbi:MAG: hypothetical protein WAK93_16505 [Solirubrobacteraceae bacterium]
MSEPVDAPTLRGSVRAALAGRLEAAGWVTLPEASAGTALAAFICPVGGDVAGTAEVFEASRIPDRPPVRVTCVFVGVSYEPLRRLAPLLDMFGVSVAHEEVWPPALAPAGGDDDDDHGGIPGVEVRSALDAERVADELAPVILDQAPRFANRYLDLQALLAETRVEGPVDIRYGALLAAAGRFAEARDALARFVPPRGRSSFPRHELRAARQLRRWIESGGDRALIPASPPPSPFARPDPTSRISFSESRAQLAKQRAAVQEVKEVGKGKSRAQAYEMLERALAEHGADERTPIRIENTLDHLWDSRTERIQFGLRGLRGLARVGVAAVKVIRGREIPDLSPPDWLQPPEHALYEFPASAPTIAVSLDPDATQWLQTAYEALPKLAGTGHLTAWLDRQPTSTQVSADLIVYLGPRRVGRVPADAAKAYKQVIEDATTRDEHPCMRAVLARSAYSRQYVLQIAKPL